MCPDLKTLCPKHIYLNNQLWNHCSKSLIIQKSSKISGTRSPKLFRNTTRPTGTKKLLQSCFARYDSNQIPRSDFAALAAPSPMPCYAMPCYPVRVGCRRTLEGDNKKQQPDAHVSAA